MIPFWINDYVGLPFKSLGRDRAGVDCWGLVYLIYREQFGREIPAYSESYASARDREEVGALIRGEVITQWSPVEAGSEQFGDSILFRCNGQPSHIGIVVARDERKFLHSREGTYSSIERYDSIHWKNRVMGFYRYVG
jgi:cell wall-associated NlpC family hydrolase